MPSQTSLEQSRLNWVFVGRDGIRAGWSVLLWLMVFWALGEALGVVVNQIFGRPTLAAGGITDLEMLGRASYFAALPLLATYVMGRIENQSFGSYGLASHHAAARWFVGLLLSLAGASALVGILYAGGFLTVDGLAVHGLPLMISALLRLLISFLLAVFSETSTRGYLLTTLERRTDFWSAAALTSLAYGAAAYSQNQHLGLDGAALGFIVGMLLCTLLRITGSLWLGIGFNTGWSWGLSFFYSAPGNYQFLQSQGHLVTVHAAGNPGFSGGGAGPTGSLFAIPILVGGLAATAWLYRNSAKAGTVA